MKTAERKKREKRVNLRLRTGSSRVQVGCSLLPGCPTHKSEGVISSIRWFGCHYAKIKINVQKTRKRGRLVNRRLNAVILEVLGDSIREQLPATEELSLSPLPPTLSISLRRPPARFSGDTRLQTALRVLRRRR